MNDSISMIRHNKNKHETNGLTIIFLRDNNLLARKLIMHVFVSYEDIN